MVLAGAIAALALYLGIGHGVLPGAEHAAQEGMAGVCLVLATLGGTIALVRTSTARQQRFTFVPALVAVESLVVSRPVDPRASPAWLQRFLA